MQEAKVITLTVDRDTCKSFQDPANPQITQVQTLLSFREAAKLEQGNANVRTPVEKKPFRRMLHTVEVQPNLFHLKNQGITYLCSKIDIDSKKGQLKLSIPQKGKYGPLNGGHTLAVVQKIVSEKLDEFQQIDNWTDPFVKVNIIACDEKKSNAVDLAGIVESLNTTLAVQPHTFFEYQNRFEDLKEALIKAGFDINLIAFRENEPGKEWDVREILQRMACFLQRWNKDGVLPTSIYRSRGKILGMFVNDDTHSEFVELYDVIGDIITLPEYLQSQFSMGGILRGKKMGRLKVAKLQNKPFQRPGTIWMSEHQMDLAASLPMAAAFRELLVVGDKGRLKWAVDYKKVFERCAINLYNTLANHSARAKTASQLGSDSTYWSNCGNVILKAKGEE